MSCPGQHRSATVGKILDSEKAPQGLADMLQALSQLLILPLKHRHSHSRCDKWAQLRSNQTDFMEVFTWHQIFFLIFFKCLKHKNYFWPGVAQKTKHTTGKFSAWPQCVSPESLMGLRILTKEYLKWWHFGWLSISSQSFHPHNVSILYMDVL